MLAGELGMSLEEMQFAKGLPPGELPCVEYIPCREELACLMVTESEKYETY